MDKKDILSLIDIFKNIDKLSIEKIPDLALYMDQITTFMEDKLSFHKRDDSQKILTKTMINNYTKDKLILPPEKKKYTKTHLISLIIIYHLKSILSINDISNIFKNFNGKTEEIYSFFINNQISDLGNLENDLINILNNVDDSTEDEHLKYVLIVLSLLNQANSRKLMAEKIIDTYLK